MSGSILWRALLGQALAVAALFALLLALPLPDGFFRAQGAWIGPLSWLACALLVAWAIGLSPRRALVAAAVSGLGAVGASVLLGHSAGMVAGVLVFGLACAAGASHPAPRRRGARTRALALTAPAPRRLTRR